MSAVCEVGFLGSSQGAGHRTSLSLCSVAVGGLHVPFPLLDPSAPGGKREMISVAFSLEEWECKVVWSWQNVGKWFGTHLRKVAYNFYLKHFPPFCISSLLKILCCCFLNRASAQHTPTWAHVYPQTSGRVTLSSSGPLAQTGRQRSWAFISQYRCVP